MYEKDSLMSWNEVELLEEERNSKGVVERLWGTYHIQMKYRFFIVDS